MFSVEYGVTGQTGLADVEAGWKRFKAGDWEGARAILAAAVERDPEDGRLRLQLGRLLTVRKLPEAEGHLRAAVEKLPGDLTALLSLAQFVSAERRVDEAEALFRRALAIDPDSLDGLIGLAKTQVRKDRFLEAFQTLNHAVTVHPTDPKVCLRYSTLLATKAMKLAETAAELRPGLAEAEIAKVHALKAMGRYGAAEAVVSAELEARPDDAALRSEAAILRGLKSGQRRRPALFPRHIASMADFETAVRQAVLPGAAPPAPILTPASRVVTLGSCFAEHLALTLRERGVDVHFQKRSEGFDNLYATRFLLDEAMGADGRRFGQIALAEHLKAADAVILSLGVSAAYFDRETGEFLPPGLGTNKAMLAAGAAFRMLSVEENLEALRDVVARFRTLNPTAALVLTLSPVPLAATFDREAAVQADAVSKSTLRLVVEKIMAEGSPGLHYWPSYEIVRWMGAYAPPEAGPVFGAEDGSTRHVSSWTVRLIMRLFLEHFGEGFAEAPETQGAAPFWLAREETAEAAG